MSFFSILYDLLIGPLELFFEVIYALAYRAIHNPGLSIICLSLAMNFLVLPLYRQADAMQAEERDIEAKLNPWIKHIKKTFKGDERFMILQTYYRQNNYKPTYSLKGSLSLLLEIPFFIAAYRFLSGLEMLKGVEFGPIKDLGAQDGLLILFGVTINILPILMTAINFVSGAIYTKGFPLKSKIQLYGMALIFLVFLYKSPAGLVFYWTLNNLFSLLKNIFYKIKNPRLVLSIMSSLVGIALMVFVIFIHPMETAKRETYIIALLAMLQLPLIIYFLKGRIKNKINLSNVEGYSNSTFYLGCVLIALLVGFLIPSTVIMSSPAEFINISVFRNPMLYLINSTSLSIGTFVIWLAVFYMLAGKDGKKTMGFVVWEFVGVAVVDYMFFSTNPGTLSNLLQYETDLTFTMKQQLINIAVICAVALVFLIVWKFKLSLVKPIYAIVICAVVIMSAINVYSINTDVNTTKANLEKSEGAEFVLDANNQNVVVIMMDRAISSYLPYLMYENPELAEQLSGFTYYPNTASYGSYTNIATPALYGGYEYTPEKMNARNTESLESKHNEAISVLPVLFASNGYKVSVCDPPYAGYSWVPDISIYKDYSNVNAFLAEGLVNYNGSSGYSEEVSLLNRNFYCYALYKIAPLSVQPILYDAGLYNQADAIVKRESISLEEEKAKPSEELKSSSTVQIRDGVHKATGISDSFMQSYNVLTSMVGLTRITRGSSGGFVMFTNNTTHDPMLLSEPSYLPAEVVDNTKYDKEHDVRYAADGSSIKLKTDIQMMHYQANMASLVQLGKWFDYLRENDLYDNTKIIIVSDHGRDLGLYKSRIINSKDRDGDTMYYNPLLMVKDFDSDEFKTDNTFMTNADVPYLATNGVIDNPKNPFTNKDLKVDESQKSLVKIWATHVWDVDENDGNTFINKGNWYTVHDNIFDMNNWQKVGA